MINNNNSPLKVLTQYINCFEDAKETRSKLDLLLDMTLSSTEADDWSADDRSDVIFFCRQTQLLLAAIFEISEPLRDFCDTLKPSPDETR